MGTLFRPTGVTDKLQGRFASAAATHSRRRHVVERIDSCKCRGDLIDSDGGTIERISEHVIRVAIEFDSDRGVVDDIVLDGCRVGRHVNAVFAGC